MVEVAACLDAWAVIAWLEGEEPAAALVDRAIQGGAVMSWVNAGEVYYRMRRTRGPEHAGEVITNLRLGLHLDDATPARVLEAAAIKAVHRMSYADAFACATANAHDAPLLTGDDEILNAVGEWRAKDIRAES